PEAQPAVASRAARVGLPEALEDEREEVRRDAFARVLHDDDELVPLVLAAYPDRAARRRELDRIRQQVAQHLLQALGIAEGDPAMDDARVEPDVPRRSDRSELVARLAHRRGDVERARVERELSADDAGHVQQVVDELRLEARAALDRLQRPRLLDGIEAAVAEEAHPAEHSLEGGAQLVRQHAQELVLRPARLLGLGARALGFLQERFAFRLGAPAI